MGEDASRWARIWAWIQRHPRSFWVPFLIFVVAPLYFPINHFTDPQRAITLDLPFERALPFVPAFIWIYTLIYLSAVFPLLVVRSDKLFHNMGMAYGATLTSAFLVFLAVPVTTRPLHGEAFRPAIGSFPDDTFTTWALSLNFHLDPPNNCFPSLHIAMAFVSALACRRADRLLGGVALTAAMLIGVATMLVKQHYLADVVGGFALALFWDAFLTGRYDPEAAGESDEVTRRMPRWVGATFIPIYLSVLGFVAILYASGVRPWAQ